MRKRTVVLGSIVATTVLIISSLIIYFQTQSTFKISVAHINDFESTFGGSRRDCRTNCRCFKESNCHGGIARLFTIFKNLAEQENFISINAGSNIKSSPMNYVFKGNITQNFLRKLNFSAYIIGNTDFENGIDGLAKFLGYIQPDVIVCNININFEPALKGLFKSSTVLRIEDKNIGITGVLCVSTLENRGLDYGNIKFLNPLESINEEAEQLNTKYNVLTVIVISHCGFATDMIMAETVGPKVSLIIGGYTKTSLYSDIPPDNSFPEGVYPVVVKQKSGYNVLVVNTPGMSRYVGNLTMILRVDGHASSWSGAPIYLDEQVKKDAGVEQELKMWEADLKKHMMQKIAETKNDLIADDCRGHECLLGNLITNSMFEPWKSKEIRGTHFPVALIPSHPIRASIRIGPIYLQDVIDLLPYGNTNIYGTIRGIYLTQALESATLPFSNNADTLPQICNMRVVYNLTESYGRRVRKVEVKCKKCKETWTVLSEDIFYDLIIPNYILTGRTGYGAIVSHFHRIYRGNPDIVDLIAYLNSSKVLELSIENRITFLNK